MSSQERKYRLNPPTLAFLHRTISIPLYSVVVIDDTSDLLLSRFSD
jgi:hypothetical protein